METTMKEYRYEDISLGLTESFSVIVNKEMHLDFSRNSGDINPMHVDVEYAKLHGYQDVVVFGMLTASFYSTLVGVYLPGKYALLQGVNTTFHAPVFSGDTLLITGSVVELRDKYKMIEIKAKIINQCGKTVSRAMINSRVLH